MLGFCIEDVLMTGLVILQCVY